MRLFVGIPLEDVVARELSAVTAKLRDGGSADRQTGSGSLRWTEPESWHITLQFLGNTTREQFDCLRVRLRDVRSGPVAVQLGELGVFDRAGVFFADVEATQGLAALQQHVVEATSRCGFAAEERPFHPHITLARAKGDGSGAKLRALRSSIRAQPSFSRFMAREFLLYESFLGAGGSKYEVRERFGLGGRPA